MPPSVATCANPYCVRGIVWSVDGEWPCRECRPARSSAEEGTTTGAREVAELRQHLEWSGARPGSPILRTLDSLAARLAAAASPPEGAAGDEDLGFSDCCEVLCRVFDDSDEAREEFLAWYEPGQWLHIYRALGAFIRQRLASSPSVLLAKREAHAEALTVTGVCDKAEAERRAERYYPLPSEPRVA